MAFKYFYAAEFGCCFVRFEGELSPGEVLAQMKEAMATGHWTAGTNFLQDFRRSELPYAGYEHFAMNKDQRDALDGELGPCRIAFVAGSKAQFGMLRQLVMMSPDRPVERSVFTDVQSAKLWLGVPESFRIVFPAASA